MPAITRLTVAVDSQSAQRISWTDATGVATASIYSSGACERPATLDKCVASNGAVDLQRATLDIRITGIRIGSREVEGSRADLGQRASAPAGETAVLHHT